MLISALRMHISMSVSVQLV